MTDQPKTEWTLPETFTRGLLDENGNEMSKRLSPSSLLSSDSYFLSQRIQKETKGPETSSREIRKTGMAPSDTIDYKDFSEGDKEGGSGVQVISPVRRRR